ncbi:MAG: rhodanese-like domain-containing protein [Anaerolineales bacterium]|nr:rhodanese-like domain-containing protein [Anaerolineales bacterium]
MTKQKVLLVLLILVLALAACGGGTETAVPAADVAPVAVADTASTSEELNLPPTVDVATVASVKDRDDVFVIDVREQYEYDEKHIPGVTLIPLGTLSDNLSEIPTDKTVIVTCRSGNRSGQAVDFLRQQGFTNVHNMEGGIVAWEQAGYSVEQ